MDAVFEKVLNFDNFKGFDGNFSTPKKTKKTKAAEKLAIVEDAADKLKVLADASEATVVNVIHDIEESEAVQEALVQKVVAAGEELANIKD